MLPDFLPGCLHACVPFTGTNIAIVLYGRETRDSRYCSRRWFLLSVIYQSYFSQKFNNRNLTVIISFSLFKHSWSASFSHLLGRPVLNSRWCAVRSSWLHSTPPPPSLGTACVSLPACAPVCVGALTTFSCHSVLSASPSQKAGKLGTLSSHEPRCPAVIQFPSQPPCWSRIHSEPQIKE